jgi:hypothetical protein
LASRAFHKFFPHKFHPIRCELTLARRKQSIQAKMAETIESITTMFDGLATCVDGLDPVLQKILDQLSAMDACQMKSDEHITATLSKLSAAEGRLQ